MPESTPRQRLAQLVLSTGLLTALIVTTYFMTSISKVSSATLQWLHVEGNRIVDESGKTVILRGVNIENREWIWNSEKSIAFERKAIPIATGDPPNGWGANIVTLAVASGPVNRGDRTYLSFLDELVTLAKSHGAYTFLVYRYAEPDTEQPMMPDQAAQDAMAALARRYASEPAVLYGLQVEPHDVSWSQLKPRFTSMVDAIRANNPRALIAVPGTQWGRYIHWALSSPIPRDNLIYKSHYYDPYTLIDSQYQLSSVAAVYPVILGEFGAGLSTSLSDVQKLLTRAETLGISWVGWLFHAKGPPCMLSDSSTFATTEYGAEVKKRLQAAATPVPSPTPGATVYDDTLRWADWSWGTTVNPNATTQVFAGTKALAVTLSDPWAALSLHTSGFNTSPYSRLSFAIRPSGQALPNLRVSLFGTVGGPIKRLELQPYVFPALDGWYRVSIPLTDLGGANTTIRRVQLQDFSGSPQPTFYLDDLKFLTNQPPVVNAGPDQTITLSSSAPVGLDGIISDDGLPNPPGAVTTTWSKISGPGTVTFANAKAVHTTASLSQRGTYVLRLAASDSQLSASDELTITGLPPPPPASGAVVYDDTLYWDDWSWGTPVNPNVSSPVFAGTKSLAVTYTSAWAGLSLHTPGFNTSPYSHLSFAILPGGQSFPNINVFLYDTTGQPIKQLKLQGYATAAGNGWHRISIPLTDLGGSDITITRVQLQEGSGRAQPTFYLDDFKFSSFGDYRPPEVSQEVEEAIREAAARYNLPRWFYYTIVHRESSFDPNAVGPYGETGLTQLNTPAYEGTPYPINLSAPDDEHMDYYYDMNFSKFGRWIKMSQVSPLTDPFDPHQNLARFSSGFAVPAFYLFRQVYGLDDAETLRAVAYHWNKGLFRDYDPNNWDYLAPYDRYIERYRGTVEAQDGGWDGQPVLPSPP